MKAMVTTILRQEIEVPEGWTKQDVYNFLAENQSFRDAFEGISDAEQIARVVDIMVLEEEVTELGEESYDA
jgi:predicted transcriptional regulator